MFEAAKSPRWGVMRAAQAFQKSPAQNLPSFLAASCPLPGLLQRSSCGYFTVFRTIVAELSCGQGDSGGLAASDEGWRAQGEKSRWVFKNPGEWGCWVLGSQLLWDLEPGAQRKQSAASEGARRYSVRIRGETDGRRQPRNIAEGQIKLGKDSEGAQKHRRTSRAQEL